MKTTGPECGKALRRSAQPSEKGMKYCIDYSEPDCRGIALGFKWIEINDGPDEAVAVFKLLKPLATINRVMFRVNDGTLEQIEVEF